MITFQMGLFNTIILIFLLLGQSNCFWVEYMDELADMIGVKPDLWKLFFEDPKLAIRCIFGPCVPAQYRLMGPGSWNGAKATIKGSVQRCLFPTRTKLLPKNATGKGNQSLFSISIPRHLHSYFVIIFIVFIFFCMCFVRDNLGP